MGGETFLGSPGNWSRVASFKTFRLPGGEKTSREAWRVAAALCWQSNIIFEMSDRPIHELKMVWENKINCPESSAAGRLFSAAAVLLNLVENETFEGHGPMLLESLAETTLAKEITLPFIEENGVSLIDWKPLIMMLKDESISIAYRARCFHETMADCISRISLQYNNEFKNISIGLSGGVFQNQLLVRLIRERLDKHHLKIILPASIPVNDGGLSAWQIIENYYQ